MIASRSHMFVPCIVNSKLTQLKRLREEDLEDESQEEAEEDQSTSDEDSPVCQSGGFKKFCNVGHQIFVATLDEMGAFLSLLDHPYVNDFLRGDACLLYSDKYLLSMVFTYFKRTSLNITEYTMRNFFLALFLANDVEEDDEDHKYEILPWALGRDWRRLARSFFLERDRLWERMGYRAIVSSRCCEEIMNMVPEHWAWSRNRAVHHSGAVRAYMMDDYDFEPRGPYLAPRPLCNACVNLRHVQLRAGHLPVHLCTSQSWYLSTSVLTDNSSSSEEEEADEDEDDEMFFRSRWDSSQKCIITGRPSIHARVSRFESNLERNQDVQCLTRETILIED